MSRDSASDNTRVCVCVCVDHRWSESRPCWMCFCWSALHTGVYMGWPKKKVRSSPPTCFIMSSVHSSILCFTIVSFVKGKQLLLSCVFFLSLSFSNKMSDCMQGWISTGQSPSQTLSFGHTHRREHTRTIFTGFLQQLVCCTIQALWEDTEPKPASSQSQMNGIRPLLAVVTISSVLTDNFDKQLNSLVVMMSHLK